MPIDFLPIPVLTGSNLLRFWSNVKVVGKCLVWQKCCNKHGYGIINIRNQCYVVSRVAYTIHFRTDPGSLMVCHECNNPPCVRAEHLFLGTAAENSQQRELEGRQLRSGMFNPIAKLWDSDIPRILELARTHSIVFIANKYNVSRLTISRIIQGETYVG